MTLYVSEHSHVRTCVCLASQQHTYKATSLLYIMYVCSTFTYVFLGSGVNYCYTLRTTGHGWCAQTRHLAAKATWLY